MEKKDLFFWFEIYSQREGSEIEDEKNEVSTLICSSCADAIQGKRREFIMGILNRVRPGHKHRSELVGVYDDSLILRDFIDGDYCPCCGEAFPWAKTKAAKEIAL